MPGRNGRSRSSGVRWSRMRTLVASVIGCSPVRSVPGRLRWPVIDLVSSPRVLDILRFQGSTEVGDDGTFFGQRLAWILLAPTHGSPRRDADLPVRAAPWRAPGLGDPLRLGDRPRRA